MPEKVTREEKIIELTIQKAREVKALRDGLTKDEMPTVEKIKRPKVQASKHGITQDKENANAGGEVFTNKLKKAKFSGPPKADRVVDNRTNRPSFKMRMAIQTIHQMLEKGMDTDNIADIKNLIKRSLKEIDIIDEELQDAAKHGAGGTGFDRVDSKFLSNYSAKFPNQDKNFE